MSIQQSVEEFPLRENEYIDGNMIKCSKCHGNKLFKFSAIPDTSPFFIRCGCECEVEDYQNRRNKIKVESLHKRSGICKKYTDARFDNADIYSDEFKKTYDKCRDYCENTKKNMAKGRGIYIYGSVGTGKTYLASCIVNEIIDKGLRAYITTFADVAKQIKKTFKKTTDETHYSYILKLTKIPLLVIDDIGTEMVKKGEQDTWLQEQIFDVINHRYNNQKATIFTSNYSMQELIRERGIIPKTVDRINEMSSSICCLSGDSYRNKLIGE